MQDKSSFPSGLLSPTNERHLHPAATSASVVEPAYAEVEEANTYCFSSDTRGSPATSSSALPSFGGAHNTTVLRSDATMATFPGSISAPRRTTPTGSRVNFTANQRHEVNPGLGSGHSRHTPPLPPHWRPDPAMDRWQDDLIGAVSEPSEREVFGYIQSATRALGFDHVSYGFQAPLPLSRPRLIWHNDYPPAWQKHYIDMGYPAVDPRIIRARQSPEPFLWNADLFKDVPELWADMQTAGLAYGWTQSVLNEPGGISMLSLTRREPFTPDELDARLPRMQWLALVTHKAFSRVIRARLASDSPALTARELEVLRWTADGKSAQDIAEILLLSKNTVDFHIRNSIMKLDAPNKTAAVVRAVLLGLFQ